MTSDRLSDSEADLRRYEALLEMADLVVHHGSLPELFHELGARLHEVTTFDFANFSLHDPKHSTMHLHIWGNADLQSLPSELPVDDVAGGWVWEHQQTSVLPDLHIESRFPTLLNILRQQDIEISHFGIRTAKSRGKPGMLRIHIEERCQGVRIRLEGKLLEPRVAELDRCRQSALARLADKTLVVRLDAVTYIDGPRESLLWEMHRGGANLVGTGTWSRHLVKQIQHRSAS